MDLQRLRKVLILQDRALVLWFDKVGLPIFLVGGKNASLGEMIQQLAPRRLVFQIVWYYSLCLPVLHPGIWVEESCARFFWPRCDESTIYSNAAMQARSLILHAFCGTHWRDRNCLPGSWVRYGSRRM